MGHLVHGTQQGRHFSAYYGDYCYLPLYAFVGDVPLWAQLRTSDRDAADGVVAALAQIIPALRQRCQRARIIVRGDSGFCREDILAWCEAHGVFYCLGLPKNSVLIGKLQPALADARARRCLCGAASVRVFTDLACRQTGFEYHTQKSWSRARRVIGKAEVMAAGDNPRFVVTNLPVRGFKGDADRARFTPARLYEELYCARGEMENVLKQQTLDLQADRLSTHHLASNQLRLWLARLRRAGDLRVSAGGTAARLGLGRHRAGAGDSGQRAVEVVESGGAGDGECAAGVRAVERRVSVAGTVSAVSPSADGRVGRQRLNRRTTAVLERLTERPCWRRCVFGRAKPS